MSEPLPDARTEQLLPCLAALAEMVRDHGMPRARALRALLRGQALDEQTWALEELRRWALLLQEAAQGEPDVAEAACHGLQLRGVPEASASLAVRAVVHTPKQSGPIRVQPEVLDFGELRPGKGARGQVTAAGGPGAVRWSSDLLEAKPTSFGPFDTPVTVTLHPCQDGQLLWDELVFEGASETVTIPVTARWVGSSPVQPEPVIMPPQDSSPPRTEAVPASVPSTVSLPGASPKTASAPSKAPRLVVQTGHSDVVLSVALSPDGRGVLTGSRDGTARLWDVATGQEVRRFEGHGGFLRPGAVLSVAFSPDGRWALTGSDDKTARLWDVATGQQIRRFDGHSGSVWSVAFSPNGRWALTGSDDKTARLWDVATGQQIRRFDGHSGSVWSVAFSPGGCWVLTGSDDKTARLWDVATGQQIRRFKGHGGLLWSGAVLSVAFSPDGQWVLTGSRDKTARLWGANSGMQVRRFNGHGASVSSVAFSLDGRWALTGSDDKTARLWDVATGRELRAF
jgi:WD40 repeat protein